MNWALIFIGAVFSYTGGEAILTGNVATFKGAILLPWVSWFLFPAGIPFMVVGVRGILRSRNTPKPVYNLDEEATRAKEELDRMYLREHGKLPDFTPQDEDGKP